MPITFYATLVGALVLLGGWYLIGQRLKTSKGGGSRQVKYLRNYFLNMGIFLILVTVPELSLAASPSHFSFLMAWGYIIGHVFTYIALIQLLMLTLSLSPRTVKLTKPFVAIIALLATIATIVNIKTMGFGLQPQFDYVNHVTILNASPIVAGLIGVMALACMLPTVIMFVYNSVVNPAARARSILLALGLIAIMVGGPMNDAAKTWQLYLVGDIILIVGYMVLGAGVLYRFEERIAPARAASTATTSA